MSEDRREQILVRIAEIAKTVFDPANVFRNLIDVAEHKRPACVIFDGDETADEDAMGRGRSPLGPIVMAMNPPIHFLVEAKPERIGSVVNGYRARLIKAILSDETLVALAHNRDVRFGGFVTDLSVGRSMEGEGMLDLMIRYVLFPAKL